MDHLRQGIGLRGYGQKDPKQEYKKEGYEMFVAMTWRVKSAVIGNVLRLQLGRGRRAPRRSRPKRLAAQRKALQRITESHAERRRGRARRPRPKQETVVRQTPKVGRNDPCPCGSGKKYKKCHGVNEVGGLSSRAYRRPSPAGRARRGPTSAPERLLLEGGEAPAGAVRPGRGRSAGRARARVLVGRRPPAGAGAPPVISRRPPSGGLPGRGATAG